MDLQKLVRNNIWKLKGYSSARHEFDGKADIYLDANENPYPSGINRYPDPFQVKVKERLSEIKNIPIDNLFVGNGSDEAIDLILRIFCEPGVDNILILPPTYGMYTVSADINNIEVKEAPLKSDYQIDAPFVLSKINTCTKVIFLCSPNNPTGNILDRNVIKQLLNDFNGIVVIDEAYIDFADQPGFDNLIEEYPRLIILQTLSKAWGAAGLRFGIAISNKEIIALLNKVKPPYNVNTLSQNRALEVLSNVEDFEQNVQEIKNERKRMANELEKMAIVRVVHPSQANFLLVEFDMAISLFQNLRNKGIIIRDRTNTHHCQNCLRITVGTPKENDRLLNEIQSFIDQNINIRT